MKPPSAMLNISFGLVGDEEGLVAETVAVLDCIVEVDPGESEREREGGDVYVHVYMYSILHHIYSPFSFGPGCVGSFLTSPSSLVAVLLVEGVVNSTPSVD